MWQVHVIDGSGELPPKIIPDIESERNALRVEAGVNINLDHERYYTMVVPQADQPKEID